MTEDKIIVPEEIRVIVIADEDFVIIVPGEVRIVEVHGDDFGQ
jgi:hypothetical protein